MSLLLDALKKAAQEKLEKQQNGQLNSESTSGEALALPVEQKTGQMQAAPEPDDSDDFPEDRRIVEAEEDAALELVPLEDEELRIDTDVFSDSSTGTDYQYRRSQILASELRAFNSNTGAREITDEVDNTDTGTWSLEPPEAASYSNTPLRAAQVFSNKTPDRSARLRLLLPIGGVLLAILLSGGLYAYHRLMGADEISIVGRSDIEPEPMPAKAASPADANVDPTLLIEQEDYDSLLTDDPDGPKRQDMASQEGIGVSGNQVEGQPPTAGSGAEASVGKTSTPRTADSYRAGQLNISRTRGKEPLQDILMRGYTAYHQGDFESAETAYRQALTRAPDSRDAMLGMAAVRYVAGDTEAAGSYYQKLLQRDPKDELALAALAGIEEDAAAEPTLPQTGLADESRIKLLLAEKPDSAYLHFTLGNIYADGRRWAEAENAYFDAYRLEPGNPDYAFNLAVSLDHLSKPREAARYYRQSLVLARERKPNFDTQLAVSRLDSLQKF